MNAERTVSQTNHVPNIQWTTDQGNSRHYAAFTGKVFNRRLSLVDDFRDAKVFFCSSSIVKRSLIDWGWYWYSSDTHVKSSFCFLVTSQTRHILSSGNSFFRAVLCIMAVSKDCGLKNPASQTTEGNYVSNKEQTIGSNEGIIITWITWQGIPQNPLTRFPIHADADTNQ